MSDLFNVSINIHSTKEKNISITDCINEFYNCTLVVEVLTRLEQTWYLTGYSKKEASKYKVFDGNKPYQSAIDIFEKHLQKNDPLINESIWNAQKDGLACSISHYMKFMDHPNKFNIVLDIDQKPTCVIEMIESLMFLARGKECPWIKVDSKGYWLHDRNVFPDRIYVGWMLYIPRVVLPDLIPEAAKLVPVIEDGKQKGTIIVSTEEIFDGSNKEHIAKANDIEIKLLDLGLLPLMTEL